MGAYVVIVKGFVTVCVVFAVIYAAGVWPQMDSGLHQLF